MTGFEPATTRPPDVYSTKLSYIPFFLRSCKGTTFFFSNKFSFTQIFKNSATAPFPLSKQTISRIIRFAYSLSCANRLIPPFTFWFISTQTRVPTGKNKSTLDPNLIKPNSSTAFTCKPTSA